MREAMAEHMTILQETGQGAARSRSGTTDGDGFLTAVRCLEGTWADLGFGLERAKGIEPS